MILYKMIQKQLLLMPLVIAYEISHRYSNNNNMKFVNTSVSLPSSVPSASSSSTTNNDLIYLRTQTYEFSNSNQNNNNNNSSNNENENHIYGLRNDINDFIELIPINKVQNIIGYYYNTDKNVQRAYTYLESKDFIELKNQIINIQQIRNFLNYLNETGFDMIDILNTLIKLIGDPKIYDNNNYNNNNMRQTFENEDVDENSTVTTATVGLHGLVDDILDALPQDQILSLFLEKLETSNEFSNFVHNIGSEEFTNILDSMEESRELRNLVYTLHNNGIYIGRIIDSLKAYFFLGTF